LDKLHQARSRGARVIAFMHHGVNPNFIPQPQIFPDYLVRDWASVGTQLAEAGLKIVFTGHYHSQDAAYPLGPDGAPMPTLCDVETGSLISYPNAFRIVSLDKLGALHIESRRVTEIDADTGGLPFPDYAASFMATRLPALAAVQLETLFGLPEAQAVQIAPLVAQALMAQYAGDEAPDAQTQGRLNSFVASPEPMHTLGLLLWGLWSDLPPSDNALVVPLGEP
jgi:hypothetical protein